MKKIVIFRTNGNFNMLELKRWDRKRNKFPIEVQETARVKEISESSFKQMAECPNTPEAQKYFRHVWSE